ncbi:DUF4440 domain-containing protein [Streptomyces sp. NPDC001546]|uniref:nuclear transport factor 2 family protein n=1 Tax=Streptomyces sp. NPDC001546 TaxID=3364585 RepID=UPI0036B6DFFE
MRAEANEVEEAIRGELRLMDPTVRTSRAEARQLLDPEFVEVGASGRRWSYEEILAELPEMPGNSEEGPRYVPSGMTGVALAPGVVHLTYETTLWCRLGEEAGWRMYYHQATPVPSQGD